MTGQRKGKNVPAGPPALAYDSRQAASTALCEIADRMMRGAQSLMRKATRVLDEDPAVARTIIGHLRRYGNSRMPCAEEMTLVEALLRGVPEGQCRSEQRKKLDRQRRERHRSDEDLCRRANEIARLRDEVRAALEALMAQPLSPLNEDQANQILWAVVEGRRPNRPQMACQDEGNVVEGPWGRCVMSGLEYVGDAKFKSADVKPEMTEEDWLTRAREQATFTRVAAKILNMTDEQLEQYARSLGETDGESALAAVELVEWCQSWERSYQAAHDVAKSVTLRMIVIAERLSGREVIEAAYRQ